MLTDMRLKALKPAEKIYKVSDQRGLYVAVTPTGVVSFRFDYRLNGRRETLVIGPYDSTLGMRKPRESSELDYGLSITLAEARLLLARAHRSVERGESPSRAKAERRAEAAEILTFGNWAEKYFAEAALAASTKAMRKSIYDRNLDRIRSPKAGRDHAGPTNGEVREDQTARCCSPRSAFAGDRAASISVRPSS